MHIIVKFLFCLKEFEQLESKFMYLYLWFMITKILFIIACLVIYKKLSSHLKIKNHFLRSYIHSRYMDLSQPYYTFKYFFLT